MTQIITIQNSVSKETLAKGVPVFIEGNYYFDKSDVDLELLTKKDSMYHCPIKNADADYYYLKDNETVEIGWCYETVKSSLFEGVAGKIGFYGRNTDKTKVEIIEV